MSFLLESKKPVKNNLKNSNDSSFISVLGVAVPVTDVTMRMLLLLRLVLAAAGALLASANSLIDTEGEMPYQISSKERKQAIARVENEILNLLGMAKRPKSVEPAHVPDSLKKLYKRQNFLGTANIAKRGIHANSANTVRAFNHIG